MIDRSAHIVNLNTDVDFSLFADQFSAIKTPDKSIQLRDPVGYGLITKIDPEIGLSIRAWNLTLHNHTKIHKHAVTNENEQTLHFIYIISYESCFLRSIGNHKQFIRPASRNSLILSDDIEISFQAEASRPIQVLDISVSKEWLFGHFLLHDQHMADLWTSAIRQKSPLVVLDICSSTINITVNELFHGITTGKLSDPDSTGLSTVLISSFLHSFLNLREESRISKTVYFEKILEVEALLIAHLQKTLPNLDAIAKKVAMSESTLKRHFKTIKGKSIYEYYLEKKMNLAKDLLIERELHVNEVAEKLGYENVSNFIHIFKKTFGYSPGSIKKKRLH